jgi:hypothetical protein
MRPQPADRPELTLSANPSPTLPSTKCRPRIALLSSPYLLRGPRKSPESPVQDLSLAPESEPVKMRQARVGVYIRFSTDRKRSRALSSALWKGNHLALAAFDQRADVVAPQRERLLHLGKIRVAVVDASHAAPESAEVIQHDLDHVRLHAEVRHVGCA